MRDVTKRFGATLAVDRLDLEVQDREFLVLVGPSGCGKTTALRMIAGLEDPTEGEVHIGGRCVNDLAPKDRDVAMVFQSYALYPHMSVQDNMGFGLRMRKTPRPEIKRRVEEAAQMLSIGHLLKRKPRELSGGERQRVALGRAIVRQPQAFLMDEPLSNLDAKLRIQTRAELIRLHRRLGITTVYVTHDQTEAMTMGDRIAVLNHGLLQQLAPPLEVYRRPANLFVAGFIGSPPMNLLEARLVSHDGELLVQAGEIRLRLPDTHAAATRDLDGAQVVFGIRPENIHDPALPGPVRAEPGNTVVALVDVTEPMGANIHVYLTAGERSLVAVLDAGTGAKEGECMRVALDLARSHLFEPKTGRTVI